MQQSQDGLFEGQSLLNQREQYILNRSQELDQLEKSIESSKASIEKEVQTLNEERINLEQNIASLSAREEVYVLKFLLIFLSVCNNIRCKFFIEFLFFFYGLY